MNERIERAGWRYGRQAAGLLLAVAAQVVPVNAGAADEARRYALERSGFLQLKVPAGWREEVDASTRPPVISFKPAQGEPFLVSVIPAQAENGKRAPARAQLRGEVAEMADSIRSFSVEGSGIKLKEFAGNSGPGFEFFATDAAPGAGYKYMTRGKLVVGGDVLVTFTILTNDGQAGVIRTAQGMLKSAARVAP